MGNRKASNGLTVEKLGQSALNAFRHASGATDTVESLDLRPWMHVAATAIEEIDMPLDSEHELQVNVRDFTRTLYSAYCDAAAVESHFEAAEGVARVAWEAVARHLFGLMSLDAEDVHGYDLGSQEQSWAEWAASRIPQEEAR